MTSAAVRLDVTDVEAATFVPTEQRRTRVAGLRAGEVASAALFFIYAFVLLVCYYQLRLLREPLLLSDGSAELKSYAQAAIAAVLMVLIPIYGAAFRRTAPRPLVRLITVFFVVNLAAFYVLGTAGVDIGFAYYVWVGVFGVTMIAQFWAHAAHSFNVASGQRLFPIVMVGATLGGLVGAALARELFPLLGTWNLMLVAAGLLAATVPLVEATSRAVPAASRSRHIDKNDAAKSPLINGFALVLRDRYLASIAALIMLLNCASTTGDYLLTELVLRDADLRLAVEPALDRGALVATFYGDFYFTVNVLTVVLQLLLVGRVFRWLGVSGAVLVLPAVALLGYGLLAIAPILGLIHLVKVAENGVNYSVMNTARHALFLPLPAAHQYQGKTAVDGFFWRAGDLAQAIIVYAGLNWLGFGIVQFAVLNAVIAIAWLALSVSVARQYRARVVSEPRPARRRAGPVAVAALGLAAVTAAPSAADGASTSAEPAALFAADTPLTIELTIDRAAFCRDPKRDGCSDARGTLVYHAADGAAISIGVTVRSRGRWRRDTGDCPLPALFVFFDAQTAAETPFAGQPMLPLTTHCRDRASYDQYVLKEYLAYRIYNLLTDRSLRVRLATITYRDAAGPEHGTTHFGFFTEHFDSLALRNRARVSRAEALDLARVEPRELATLALFQYMIGNTDWSAIYGHNTVALQDSADAISVVPYDFDFSGLVDSEYAGPPPELPIRSVRQRIFRGFCTPAPDWDAVFRDFGARRDAIMDLVETVPALVPAQRARTLAYLEAFFDLLASPERRAASIVAACRRG